MSRRPCMRPIRPSFGEASKGFRSPTRSATMSTPPISDRSPSAGPRSKRVGPSSEEAMPSDEPPKPPPDDAQPKRAGSVAARKQMAAILQAIPDVTDDHPTARALDLALEAAERALEPFRAELPPALYDQLILELMGE